MLTPPHYGHNLGGGKCTRGKVLSCAIVLLVGCQRKRNSGRNHALSVVPIIGQGYGCSPIHREMSRFIMVNIATVPHNKTLTRAENMSCTLEVKLLS